MRLESTGPIAGVFPGAAYQAVALDVGVGDRIVVYSDGITEFENPHGEEFGERRVLEALLSDRGGSAEETCAALVDSVRRFAGALRWIDDVTMLVVVRGAASELQTPR